MYKFGPAEYSAITAYQQKSGTYLTAVPESAISGKADVSAFELDGNGHISAYNGSAFAGGGGATYSAGANIDITDDVISGKDWTEEITSATSGLQPSGDYYSATNPSGFMSELPASATDVIDTVTANSGTWGGSALPISAGPGVKLEMNNGTLVVSTDETVLYSATPSETKISALSLSENPYNFSEIKVMYGYYGSTDGGNNMLGAVSFVPGANRNSNITLFGVMRGAAGIYYDCIDEWDGVNTTDWTWVSGQICRFGTTSLQTTNNMWCNPYKVVGINRVSGGN